MEKKVRIVSFYLTISQLQVYILLFLFYKSQFGFLIMQIWGKKSELQLFFIFFIQWR